MNNLLSQSHNILLDIIEKDIPFSLAVGKAFKGKTINQEMKNNSTTLVGCALRHQILFDELIKRTFGDMPTRVKSGIYLYLSNKIFVPKVNEKDAFAFMKQKFIDNGIDFDNEKYNVLDESTNDSKALVPSEYDAKSLEFLSFRFNTPLWLVKMWKKQFGPQLVYPILSANSKGPEICYRVNTSKVNLDEFLAKTTNFKATDNKGMVTYVGDKLLRKSIISHSEEVFEYSLGMKTVFDQVDCDPIRGVAFYLGTVNNAFLELMAQFSNSTKFELVAKHGDPYFYAKKICNKFSLENVPVYDAQPSSIITCISKQVHTFFVLPESTNFAQIRVSPDYLVHFKQESIDGYLAAQKEALEESAQFVEDGGNLVYAVSTINHKEGRAQVIAFLNKHPEFSMVTDRQIFPFDKLDSTLYYAILRKEEVKHD